MTRAPTFEHNADISSDDVEGAIASRPAFRAFLEHAAAISAPEDGAPKLLLACAALPRCGWLTGDLRIEIEGDEATTRIDLLSHATLAERIFPVVTLNAPVDEFVRAVRLAPHLIKPLELRENEAHRLVLMHRRHSDRPATRMEAVRDDVHSKPTVVRMTAVRPEAIPDSRRNPNRDRS